MKVAVCSVRIEESFKFSVTVMTDKKPLAERTRSECSILDADCLNLNIQQ